MTQEFEVRDAVEHLILIKAHMLSLEAYSTQLAKTPLCSAGLVSLRQAHLDLRMIIEELMLLSVSAHRDVGEAISKNLQKNYSATQKMKLLEKINPRFFPEAIRVVPSKETGIEGQFVSVEEDHLSRIKAEDFYNKSGNFLHASYKTLTEQEFEQAKEELADFFILAARLMHTFEVDISGKGWLIAGHLNLEEAQFPVVFSARVEK